MRQVIKRLFGLKTTANSKPPGPTHAHSRTDHRDNPLTIEENSDNGTRRQLVQMMLRDGLRRYGIPAGWVECRMLVVNGRSHGQGLYVKLVMRHWDLLLLTYAHTFQQQLLAAIHEFEPQASVWLHGISWELDVGDTCPYLDMPDPSVWLKVPANRAPVPAAAAVPAPLAAAMPTPKPVEALAAAAPENGASDPDVLLDLERMFAIRDADIKQQAFADTAPLDFQNTQPSQHF